jgi:hypothetical protein
MKVNLWLIITVALLLMLPVTLSGCPNKLFQRNHHSFFWVDVSSLNNDTDENR